MVAPDIRAAAELLEYYRRTVFEAGPIHPRQQTRELFFFPHFSPFYRPAAVRRRHYSPRL